MRLIAYGLWLAGAALLAGLLLHYGLGEVLGALAVAGWGLLLVIAFHLVPMLADTLAWRRLLGREPPGLMHLLAMRWIGESVNGLLPAAQVGGDLVRARLAILAGVKGSAAVASVIVDLTLSVLTLALFGLAGVLLLVALAGPGELALPIALGLVVGLGLLLGFYLAQRGGLFGALASLLARFARQPTLRALVRHGQDLDAATLAIYRRHGDVLASGAWALAAWALGAGEIWLALHVLGAPVGVLEALVLESLSQAVRGAAFLVPGALGVQEGGLIVIGATLGIGPELALALSLAKRARELALGLPGLLAWQLVEGGRLRARGRD